MADLGNTKIYGDLFVSNKGTFNSVIATNLKVTGTSLIKQSTDQYISGLKMQRAATLDTWSIAHRSDNALYFGYAANSTGADAEADYGWKFYITSAGAIYVGSSHELKKNIRQYKDSGLEIINDLKIVSFNYKTDKDNDLKVGIIAEDSPEIISSRDHNSLDIINSIGLLFKAVQELSDKIDKLENK